MKDTKTKQKAEQKVGGELPKKDDEKASQKGVGGQLPKKDDEG